MRPVGSLIESDSATGMFLHEVSSESPSTVWAEPSASFPPTWKVKRGSDAQLKGEPMGKKLYVGNMSYEVDSSALEALFAPHGTVESAQVISDRDTGRSKGFGFVEMSSDAEAQAAIAAVNGQDHGGRALTVNEAKPKENRTGGAGGGGRSNYASGGGRSGGGGGRSRY